MFEIFEWGGKVRECEKDLKDLKDLKVSNIL